MSIRMLTGTAALALLMTGTTLTVPALAQETPPAAQTPATQTATGIPDLVTRLGLTDLEIDSWKNGGREYEGELPDGTEIEAKFDRDGLLVEIEADDGPMPAIAIEQVLPQAVRDSEVFGQFTRIERINVAEDGFDLRGRDQAGARMRARVDATGAVQRFGREGEHGEMRGEMRGEGKRGEMRGHREGGRPGDHARGPREGGPREGGPMRAAPDFDAVAANARLTEAGYTGFGFLYRAGPRLLLEATNPDGEAVTLEFDARGEVIRETAR